MCKIPRRVHPVNVSTPGSESQAHPPTLSPTPPRIHFSLHPCPFGIHGIICKIINGQYYSARKILGVFLFVCFIPVVPYTRGIKGCPVLA